MVAYIFNNIYYILLKIVFINAIIYLCLQIQNNNNRRPCLKNKEMIDELRPFAFGQNFITLFPIVQRIKRVSAIIYFLHTVNTRVL